jgi:hypothetical protein
MKRLESFSLGGYFLTLPPGDNHVWTTEGLPTHRTDNSSLKRESLHQYRSLFTSPVKWRVDRLPVDADTIVADILNLSTTKVRAEGMAICNKALAFSDIT